MGSDLSPNLMSRETESRSSDNKMTSKASQEVLDEIRKEYAKFLDVSKKKSDSSTDGQQEEKSSWCCCFSSDKPTVKLNSVSPMMPDTESFKKFLDKAKQQTISLSEHHFTMPTIWKSPEPLHYPSGLKLGLIGVSLFSGNEIFSKAIRRFTKSKYSHVALLMHDVNKDKSDPDGWYIYSANGSAGQILDDHRFPQVQLEKWVDSLKVYDGAAGTRMIAFKSTTVEPDPGKVSELVEKFLGLPYETQLLVMLKALNRSNVESAGHASSAFCSEICYRFLIDTGVLENTEIPENVWPKDFSDENEKLPLINGDWETLVLHKGTF